MECGGPPPLCMAHACSHVSEPPRARKRRRAAALHDAAATFDRPLIIPATDLLKALQWRSAFGLRISDFGFHITLTVVPATRLPCAFEVETAPAERPPRLARRVVAAKSASDRAALASANDPTATSAAVAPMTSAARRLNPACIPRSAASPSHNLPACRSRT